jgi:amino acid adenylation domain-containing protein
MPDSTPFSCFIIGEGILPIQCAEILIAQGHAIYGVISPDPAVRHWANEHHILHSYPQDNLLGFIGQQPFDYLFSIVNPVILPAEMLTLPRKAAINYHDAPLPKYAGTSATFWALIYREAAHGVTWHEMSVQVDAGNILKQQMVEIAPHETTFTLNTKCYEAAIQAFAELVADLAADRVMPIRQNLAERSFFPQSKRPALGAVISWQQPAEAIGAFVRALDFGPYPNPKGLPKLAIGAEFLIIAELDVLGTCSTAAPGTITGIDHSVLQVATTTTDIALRKLLTIDGQNLPLAEVVATFGLRQGDQLPALSPERAERLTALHAAIGRHETFWSERLAALQPIMLPFVERQTPGVAVESAQMTMPIPDTVRSYLARCQEDVSSFLRTAFVAYLMRIGRMNQFDLGFSCAALRGELGDLDRFFASTLPLRVEVTPECSYKDLAQTLAAQVAVMEQRKTYVRDITMRYPTLRALPERRRGPVLPVGVVEVADLNDMLPPADLMLAITEADASCVWVYNPAVLDLETVERMQRQFVILLQSLATDPAQPLADLPLLSEAERRQILYDWNATARAYPESCTHELIAAQAARTPDALAVICGDQRLSYQDLDQRANQLAHHLQMLGIGPEVCVGICVKPSLEVIVGLLGILKAGGAYVPLDPAYPRERLAWMLEDSRSPVLVTQQHLLATLPPHHGHTLCLDRDWSAIAQQPTTHRSTHVKPDHLAYVIYTSGSTGVPKGVMVAHRGLTNYLQWAVEVYRVAEGEGAPVHSSLGFDLTVTSLFTPLLCGGSVWLLPHALHAEALSAALNAGLEYSLVKLTPAHLDLLHHTVAAHTLVSQTRALVIGGEALHYDTIDFWRAHAPGTRLINEYGPTEAVVGCCIYEVIPGDPHAGTVPIGRATANTQIYILDIYGQPVPIGMAGEIYLGGVQLARGYHDRPALTAEKFVPDPFSSGVPMAEGHPPGARPGSRLYRTGDLARYRSDGQIEFIDRIDQQVKLRGFRIELGEIEAVLLQHHAVEQAVVMMHTDQSGGQRLVGYVVKSQPADNDEALRSDLHSFIQTQLPTYMVPATILLLADMPLTPNGKIDRKALSKLNIVEASRHTTFVAPRTPLEEALVGIWQEACRLSHIGVDDNFFELGGNSLGATQIVSRVQRTFKVHLTVRDILATPTVAALARHLLTYERQPGQMDKVAVALKRVWSMSPEERQRMLQQKKAK